MKKRPYDPILAEMHAIKDAISAEFNHDIDQLFDHLREQERKSMAAGRKIILMPARPMKRPRSTRIMRRRKPLVKVCG
jgi:hypothetical protein